MIQELNGKELDPHYLAYFECFNRQLFFEAHEVLEELWLPQRVRPNGAFYKGLIQLAGAFVHLQKRRLGPAAALFRLARSNLANYPARYEALDVLKVQELIENWLTRMEQGIVDFEELKPPKLFVSREEPPSGAISAPTQKSAGAGSAGRDVQSQAADPTKLD